MARSMCLNNSRTRSFALKILIFAFRISSAGRSFSRDAPRQPSMSYASIIALSWRIADSCEWIFPRVRLYCEECPRRRDVGVGGTR
eukprot:31138-Pelagococcus_subviridis.AAC.12